MDMAKKVNVYDCIVEQGDEVTKVLLTGTSAKDVYASNEELGEFVRCTDVGNAYPISFIKCKRLSSLGVALMQPKK
jgi:hypothetical protein